MLERKYLNFQLREINKSHHAFSFRSWQFEDVNVERVLYDTVIEVRLEY